MFPSSTNFKSSGRRLVLGGMAASMAAAISSPAGATDAAFEQAELWRSHIKLIDASGTRLALDDVKAPLLFINLWANWCSNCLLEFASMRRLAAALGASNAEVLLVSHPNWWAQDQVFARKNAIGFRSFAFPPEVDQRIVRTAFHDVGNLSLPQTLVMAGADRVPRILQVGGIDWAQPKVIASMRELVSDAQKNRGWAPGS